MSSSRTNIIGLKVHCNACEKEFPIGKQKQTLLHKSQPIVCLGCKVELMMSAAEKERLLGFGNPLKYMMLASMISGLMGVILFGGYLLGYLKSEAFVLVAVVVTLGSNLVLGPKIKNASAPLMVNLDPKSATMTASAAP
ncbi:hypothetical protein [Pseudomonas sp. PDM25]|uniref:hypothetical protein n=1 Tax=Pseudomonas sp. PDM25 TaxID=2854772 RepID=UPI001C485705|nr:hypothetical protein [Pseudomonas sp. PDM25]MBV7515838.1 hypothetical protein [Pseudomonas sp. PDM25]